MLKVGVFVDTETDVEKKKKPRETDLEIYYEEERKRKPERQRAALRWWVGTVVLTLFPTLTTLIVAALRWDTIITLDLIFHDGELILCSFLIVTSTLVSCYNVKMKSVFTDGMLYLLFGSDFIQLIAYTVIKTNEKNNLITISIVSIISLIISIVSSWIWYQMTSEGV